MRTIVIAASLLASLAAPAFAQGRHARHVAMPSQAAEFMDVAPTNTGAFSGGFDRTSANLLNDRHCAWVACSN